jgi:hypothetical protein
MISLPFCFSVRLVITITVLAVIQPCIEGGCCACSLLAQQPDFLARLEEEVQARNHVVIFYPKFSCELNFTEPFWCAAKYFARENCQYVWLGRAAKNDSSCFRLCTRARTGRGAGTSITNQFPNHTVESQPVCSGLWLILSSFFPAIMSCVTFAEAHTGLISDCIPLGTQPKKAYVRGRPLFFVQIKFLCRILTDEPDCFLLCQVSPSTPLFLQDIPKLGRE